MKKRGQVHFLEGQQRAENEPDPVSRRFPVLGLGVGRFEKLYLQGEPLVIPAEHLPVAGVVAWGVFLLWMCLPSVILALSGPKPLEEHA